MISIGPYPVVKLADARDRRFELQCTLLSGVDPAQKKRDKAIEQKDQELTKFPVVARAWLQSRIDKKYRFGLSTQNKARSILEHDMIPAFLHVDIAKLTTPQAICLLEKIEARAPHMAEKAQGYLNQIIVFAIRKGLREDGKTLSLRGAVKTPKATPVPAAITENDLAHVLTVIDRYPSEITQTALRFASLTTMRPANVVQARWEHIDLKDKTWTIPGPQMKSGEDHTIPLPTQAIKILATAASWKQRDEGWVFPPISKQKTPHLHRDALSKALRESGLRDRHVPHGFRASFRTIARERWKIDIDVLEAQIAHAKKGEINKAYD